jgi:hypothetical protein
MKILKIRYRAPGVPWTQKFRHVVGIAHTNYLVYSKALQGGSMKAAILFLMNQWMCRAYCHKVRRFLGPSAAYNIIYIYIIYIIYIRVGDSWLMRVGV